MRGGSPTSTELIDFLQNAGIHNDHPIVAYLTHIGLTSDISFVEFKKDTNELAAWCEKFKTEVTFGDAKIGPMDGDQLAAMKASLIATYKAINRNIASHAPAAPSATTPTIPTTIQLKEPEDKVPKTLPTGVYAELVEHYNKVTIHGQRRVFPEKLLLGAEKVLARMWHEHHKSKRYTRVTLGELLQHRHFTATGNINNRATDKKNETVLTIDADTKTLVEKNKQEWDPHTLLMIIDGLDAIKWAWTLIRIGDETDINSYIQRFETLTRRHSDRLPQIKDAWITFSSQIAMQMRAGITFKQATQDVLQDTVQLTDILSQPSPKKPRRDTTPSPGGKGKGKGKQYWRPSRFNRRFQQQPYYHQNNYQQAAPSNFQPTPQPQWQQQPQWNPPPPPANWQQQPPAAHQQWTQPPRPPSQHGSKGGQKGKGGKKGKQQSQWQ